MEKCNWNISKLAYFLKKSINSRLICFGTGMVARHIEHIFDKYGLWEKTRCFADNDAYKQGKIMDIGGREFPIISPSSLCEEKYARDIVVILCEHTEAIERQLRKNGSFAPLLYIAYPDINAHILRKAYEGAKNNFHGLYKAEAKFPIPPILHYCWFGNEKMPERQSECLATWKAVCPGYTIMEWNESNYDINVCRYVKEAYETGNYAFVSDYARMDVVYRYGGIYLDTDVELMQNLYWLRKYSGFFSFGKWPAINSGSGFGAEAGNELIKEIRDCPRNSIPFIMEDGRLNKKTNCYYESAILERHGFKMDFSTQLLNDILLLSPFFFPSSIHQDVVGQENRLMMAYHHDAGSWRK